MKKTLLAIVLATAWISISEFVRNEYLLKQYWIDHYHQLGLEFPAAPVNGVIWGIWSLCFSVVLVIISRRYSLLQTIILGWLLGFVMMWLVIGNLQVLPFGILPVAIPLSILEVGLASLIAHKLGRKKMASA